MKSEDLITFNIKVMESDLMIQAESDLTEIVENKLIDLRYQLERYIEAHPKFKEVLVPIQVEEFAPKIIHKMVKSALIAGVGPMAAIAGAVAEEIGEFISPFSTQWIIENGGDIFMKTAKERVSLIYAGDSPFSMKLGIKIKPEEKPIGICTSSATVGHSKSFGRADAVSVLSSSAALSDAVATSLGNMVKKPSDIPKVLEFGIKLEGIKGILIIMDEEMGAIGEIELTRI